MEMNVLVGLIKIGKIYEYKPMIQINPYKYEGGTTRKKFDFQ